MNVLRGAIVTQHRCTYNLEACQAPLLSLMSDILHNTGTHIGLKPYLEDDMHTYLIWSSIRELGMQMTFPNSLGNCICIENSNVVKSMVSKLI